MSVPRTLVAVIASAVAAAGLATPAFGYPAPAHPDGTTATALADGEPFPPIDASAFRISAGSSFQTYASRIAALEHDTRLAPVPLTTVLAGANKTARALCHQTYLETSLDPGGLCWQGDEDDNGGNWLPQGISGSGDASAANGEATYDGHRVIAVDWHWTGDTFIRVSFLDLDTNKYRHVLLVEPTSDGNFRAVTGHGHGMFWSGDKLVVATSGTTLRVFDLKHIWHMNWQSSDAGTVGKGADGEWHARYHAYALPEIGAYTYDGSGACVPDSGAKACFHSLGFDHSGSGSFLASEYLQKGPSRIVRWPLDPATGLPKISSDGYVHALEAFESPVWATQGVTAYDGTFTVAGMCPDRHDQAGNGVDYPSCLLRGSGGGTLAVWTHAPKNTENLSYWPTTGQLWLDSEQTGERVLAHVDW